MVFRALLAALLAVASLSASARQSVTVNVSLPDNDTVSTRQVMVNMSFTNTGTTPVRMVNWFLPDGDLDGDMFYLSRDGAAVSYLGPLVKRAAPTAHDMITLEPGESVTRAVDLASAYDMSRSGTYSIQYGVASSHLFAPTNRSLRSEFSRDLTVEGGNELVSNEVVAWVDGRKGSAVEGMLARASEKTETSVNASTISYTGRCSTTQQSTLVSAVGAASTMANGAVSYLSGSPSATQRYTTWFGTYSSANWDTVKGHFVNVKDALDNKPLTLDCQCKKSYYAYVYPNQPYKIYLCRAFWNAPLTGTDSKGGTLIHELTHFTVVAGTDDYAYGQTAAKQLAISNPAQARANADSHEYFAENTPNLP